MVLINVVRNVFIVANCSALLDNLLPAVTEFVVYLFQFLSRDAVMNWLYNERFPAFQQTKLYLLYKLHGQIKDVGFYIEDTVGGTEFCSNVVLSSYFKTRLEGQY